MEILTDYKRKKQWNDFVANNSDPVSFLQSFEWGEFNKKVLGNEITRWAVIEEDEIKIAFTFIKKSLPAGNFYWYCPRGLIWHKNYRDKRVNAYGPIIKKMESELAPAIFMRTCPPTPYREHIEGFLGRLGYRKPKILTSSKEPETTWVLDLDSSDDELLSEMHQKTRYNIRLAEKKGVKVREMTEKTKASDTDIFYNLSKGTAERNKIKIYGKDYYKKMINFFTSKYSDVELKMYIAEKENKPLSAAIVIYFGSTATYLHGASSSEDRDLMPNYLMQWEAIKNAKEKGMKIYDFWGISELNRAWSGITRFKKGFGGREIRFIGTWDYIFNRKWYNTFRILKLLKKIIP